MTDDILTGGLQMDRYLKATKLIDQFETTLLETLEAAGREMLTDAGFDPDVTFDNKVLGEDHSATLATIRTEGPLLHDGDAETRRLLNVAMEWVNPETHDEESTTGGSFCYVLYKLQHGSPDTYQAVKDATTGNDSWGDIRFGEDQWYSARKHAPGTIFISVADDTGWDDLLQRLTEHFVTIYAPAMTR